MKRSQLPPAVSACIFSLTVATTSDTELSSRLDGAAAYDDVLNITWLTDAAASGNNTWASHLSWVDSLNSSNHLGFSHWRLAAMSVTAGLPTGIASSVVDCSTIWQPLCQDNELGYMFYHTLGGTPGNALTGGQTVGDVTLTNIQSRYWSATASGITNAWMYHFNTGAGFWSPKNGNRFGWAVHPGDIGTATFTYIGDGDLAPLNEPDGVVNAADVLVANRIILGLVAAGPQQLAHGDVYPPGDPDGVINLQDLILIQQLAVQ